jgi:hypothetical protein
MAMQALRMAAVCLLVALAPATLSAQPVQDPLEMQARKDCLLGKVDAGVEALADLFTRTNNPNYIYNQARCYEQNSRPAEAIQRFLEYQRIARDVPADEQAQLERHLGDCRAQLADQQKAQQRGLAPAPAGAATVPWGPSNPPPVPREVAPAFSPAPPSNSTPALTAAPNRSSGLRSWCYVTAATGLLATGAGITLSVLTRSTQNSVESDGRQGVYDPDKDARGKAFATWQWVGYGVGAAGLLTAATLYYLDRRADSAATQATLALVPFVDGNQGGLLFRGGF